MDRFTRSLRSSVAHGDWYVALTTALTLPDVCGRMVSPEVPSSRSRYTAWFNDWMSGEHVFGVRSLYKDMFLTGDDCYALRCSYLHEGGSDITRQKAQDVLEDFHFIEPPPGGNIFHLNQFNNTLQVQVDIFCGDMAGSVDAWSRSVGSDAEVQKRMALLLKIWDRLG